MIRFLILSGIICLSLSLSGQTPEFKSGITEFERTDKHINAKGILNASEILDSTINETWNTGTNLWDVTAKRKFTYSSVGNTTTVITLIRNANSIFIWVNSGKTETTVNTAGKETSRITSSWNNTLNQWIPSEKQESIFDAGGVMTSYSTYSSTSGTSIPVWVGASKIETAFSSENTTINIGYKWEPDPVAAWVKTDKREYTYSEGNLTKFEFYVWDKTLSVPDWVKSSKFEYTYTGGKNSLALTYYWDKTLPIPDYVNYIKNEYTYDGNGNVSLSISCLWDITLEPPDWVNSLRGESTYDLSGRKTMDRVFSWNKTLSAWVGSSSQEVLYSTSNGLSYSIRTNYRWDILTSGWVKSNRTTNWYSGLNTAVTNMSSDNQVIVYPNPASENITFSGISGSATVELIDMNGSKVLERKLTDEGVLPLAGLTKGLYIYKVSANGITRTGRVVLK
jgi:hypothetical protein